VIVVPQETCGSVYHEEGASDGRPLSPLSIPVVREHRDGIHKYDQRALYS
jgi:hypothetical protein